MPKCPVCNDEYEEKTVNGNEQNYCSKCGWLLKLYSSGNQIPTGFGPKSTELQELEDWGRRLWEENSLLKSELEKLEEIVKDRDRLKKELDKLADADQKAIQPRLVEPDILNILEEKIAQLDKKLSSKISTQIWQQVNPLQQEINKINQEIGKIKSKLDSELSSSDEGTQLVEQGQQEEEDREADPEINLGIDLTGTERELVNNYNGDGNELLKTKAEEVSETKESMNNRRLGNNQPVLFEKTRRGNYWIISEGGYNYLVPKGNLKFNEHNYKAVLAFFECHGYKPGYSDKFQLLKPAKVSSLPEVDKWKLEDKDKGILQFIE